MLEEYSSSDITVRHGCFDGAVTQVQVSDGILQISGIIEARVKSEARWGGGNISEGGKASPR